MSAEPTHKPRLLVIDDEPLVLGMITRLLRRRYDVTSTTSGQDGLSLASQQPWDAILCDVMLPELNGPEILQRLEQQGSPAAAKLGFMTGGAFGTETSAYFDRLAPDEWLAKPFGAASLAAFVDRLVSRASDDV